MFYVTFTELTRTGAEHLYGGGTLVQMDVSYIKQCPKYFAQTFETPYTNIVDINVSINMTVPFKART